MWLSIVHIWILSIMWSGIKSYTQLWESFGMIVFYYYYEENANFPVKSPKKILLYCRRPRCSGSWAMTPPSTRPTMGCRTLRSSTTPTTSRSTGQTYSTVYYTISVWGSSCNTQFFWLILAHVLSYLLYN